ncbi:MAG: pyruvate, phosphate dikinase, partial [Planctomycetes bacterium]|nr:pyruvate, phosphate dikinase [Planctomycetota bacterium]
MSLPRWSVILDFLRATDRSQLLRLTQRMINSLCVAGVPDAEEMLQQLAPRAAPAEAAAADENRPLARQSLSDVGGFADRVFDIAARELGENGVIARVQQWIAEERAGFLYEALENLGTSLSAISEALLRYRALHLDDELLPRHVRIGLQVALLRRFFCDRLDFVRHVRDYADVESFYELAQRCISPAGGHGKLGGKSAGLFAAANIVRKSALANPLLASIRVPKTWYLTSDANLLFVRHNRMEDVYNSKYRPIEQVRLEYPHLVQVFKNGSFPAEITQGLSMALDDFANHPIIVRSSSLLEDQSGASG